MKVQRIFNLGMWMLMMAPVMAMAETQITDLRVADRVEPLAVEDSHPLFSWRMESDQRGQSQKAYQIVVKRAKDGSVVWNTGRVERSESVNIPYMGVTLQPQTAYEWELQVWDAQGRSYKQQSKFETSLMESKISGWSGAKWIGISSHQRLDAATHYLFEIETNFRIEQGGVASLILGANDFRFNDAFQNPDNMKGENYVRIEIDLSGVGQERGAVLNIYRVGYAKGDREGTPLHSISAANYPNSNINQIFTAINRGQTHKLQLNVDASSMYFIIDDVDLITEPVDPNRRRFGGFAVGHTNLRVSNATRLQVSPYGSGGNFNPVPNLCEIGFAAMPGSTVVYTDYHVNSGGHAIDKTVFNQHGYGIFDGMMNVKVDGGRITVSNDTDKMTLGYADPSHGALTMLRTEFSTSQGKEIERARVYATAMGAYEMFINGKRMGEDWFAPGDSQYRETMGYHAYDVTSLLKKGTNAIGAQLNPGWFTGYMTFTSTNYNFFGDHEALLMKMVIDYTDGTQQTVVTNPDTWKAYNDGPIRNGSFFNGERYDANKEAMVAGWKEPGFNANNWLASEVIEPRDWMHFDFMARYDEPVRVRETLTATQLMPTHSADQHTFIYNMGVNMVGVPEISIPEGYLNQGDVVILRYAEQLYPGFSGDESYYVRTYGRGGKNIAGRPQYETMRAALVTDFYIAKGSEAVVIRPTTTYRGYQYIQITLPSHAGPLDLENVKGLVLSSDNLPTGTYEATTSDANKTAKLVNQLMSNIQRSQLGNFFTIPTDCPQRNERMGWTGDAQAYTRTATYNSDALNFFRQWMVALRADQGVGGAVDRDGKIAVAGGIGSTVPTYNQADDDTFADGTTWSAAVCMVPWQLYSQYGNTQVISENMEAMLSWLNGMDYYDQSPEYPHLSAKATGLADWLAMDNRTPSDLVNNAIYIYMMDVTAKMAEVIGRTDIAEMLHARHDAALDEWNRCYVDPATGMTRTQDGKIVHSQSSYATPLNFNCFNEQNKAIAETYLALLAMNPTNSGEGDRKYPPYTITTGFSGTPNILPALSRAGKVDEAYRMFTCTDYTSWLYPVTKGATSVWERWNGYEAAFGAQNQNSMNSFNHFALGAVGQWMYEYQLGITTPYAEGKGGYKHFILQPAAGHLYTSLSGSYRSNYGVVKSAWVADGKGTMIIYETTIPANTTATLYLPITGGVDIFGITDGARYVGKVQHNGISTAHYELESGSYSFRIEGNGVTVK